MKSFLLTAAVALPLFSAGAASADCYYGDEIRRSARLVAEEAEDMHDITYRRYRYQHLSDDALEVAEGARSLGRLASYASCRRLRDAYDDVARDFNRLRRGFENVGFHSDQRVLEEWSELVGAMYELEQSALGIDDDLDDPDYPY